MNKQNVSLLICTWMTLLPNLVLAVETINSNVSSEEVTKVKDIKSAVSKELSSFYAYRPNYIGYSAYNSINDDKGSLKFQLSIKYELLQDTNIFFGYTQKSFWSIQKPSAPFAENNFSPEAFYIFDNTKKTIKIQDYLPDYLKYVQFGVFRHESTGEAGSGSHGWNTSYIEPTFAFGKYFTVTPKIWIPAPFCSERTSAPDNPDIYKYYGYGEINAKYAFDDLAQLSATFRHGTEQGKYGIESKIDFGLKPIAKLLGIGINPNPTLFVQIWNGYGESLKNYNQNTTNLVIGITAIR